MRRPISMLLATMLVNSLFGQTDSVFDREAPLDIAFSMSVREIKKSKGDTIYQSRTLFYTRPSGTKDSIKVGLRGRGNSRTEICYFPPLWIKITKRHAKGTLFEGNKKLKLVMPCGRDDESNDLIIREYLCYKLYEIVTNCYFRTRLVDIELTELRGKKSVVHMQKGILIEDADKTAKRFNAKLLKNVKLDASFFLDTAGFRFDLFQFMIANTDWSKQFEHNTKIIHRQHKAIGIPYDFDMSGLVDASYAVVSQINGQQLPITSVTERYYRGFCQSKEITEFVREEFLAKEERFLGAADKLQGQLPDKQIREIKNYLSDFFSILKNENSFKTMILDNCREF